MSSGNPALSFAAEVEEWVKQSQARLNAVYRGSVQDLVDEMQKVGPSVAATRAAIRATKGMGPISAPGAGGHMPVDTGFLRASFRLTKGAPAPIDTSNPSRPSVAYNPDGPSVVIAGLQIGETVYGSYTAAYARRLNYGFVGEDSLGRTYNQRGYYFVDLAVQKWQQIVNNNVQKLRDAIEAKNNAKS